MTFLYGYLMGLATVVLIALAVSAVYLAHAEYHRARPADDPYRDLKAHAWARRP